MNEIARFSIELPDDLAGVIRARMASGAYASESEVIRKSLELLAECDEATEQWLQTEIATAYDEWKAGQSGGLTIDEVRQKLKEARGHRHGRA